MPVRMATQFEGDDNRFRTNAEELIAKVPVVFIDGDTALCDGGGGPLGHPIEYIRVSEERPEACKYCGIRYQKQPAAH